VAHAWADTAANLSDVPGPCRGLARYVLKWSYRLDGFDMSAISFADLVVHRADTLVTPADVDARFPGWIDSLPAEHQANQGADFIAEAFRAVRTEAVGDEHAQRKVRDASVLRELVHVRTNVIHLEQNTLYNSNAQLATAERTYRACYARLIDFTRSAKSRG